MEMDILSVLEHKFPSFSKGQRTIAQFILKNYDKAAFMTAERIEAAESTMDGHDVLKAVLRADINNLQATLDEIDQDYFNQAVDMILSAKHIYIIGMRTSTTLADFLAIYLKLLLDDVTVVKEIAAREVYEQLRHQLPALFQAHDQRHEVCARPRCTLPRPDGRQGLAAQ